MSEQSSSDAATSREDERLSQIMARHPRKNELIARQLSREAVVQSGVDRSDGA